MASRQALPPPHFSSLSTSRLMRQENPGRLLGPALFCDHALPVLGQGLPMAVWVSSSGQFGARTRDRDPLFQDRQSRVLEGEAAVSSSSAMSPQEMNSRL